MKYIIKILKRLAWYIPMMIWMWFDPIMLKVSICFLFLLYTILYVDLIEDKESNIEFFKTIRNALKSYGDAIIRMREKKKS